MGQISMEITRQPGSVLGGNQHRSQRSRRPVGDLVEAARDGKITLGQVPVEASEGRSYHAFRLRRTELEALSESILPAQPPDPIPGAMSAAEFARSIGIRDRAQFLALIEAGHVPAFRTLHPQTHREQWRMTEADIAALHEKFATITTLSARFGLHRNTVRLLLAKSKIQPFCPGGADFGAIWLLAEVQAAFPKEGHALSTQGG